MPKPPKAAAALEPSKPPRVDSTSSTPFLLVYEVLRDRKEKVALKYPLFGPANAHAQWVDHSVREYFDHADRGEKLGNGHLGVVAVAENSPAGGFPIDAYRAVSRKIASMLDTLPASKDHSAVDALQNSFGTTRFNLVWDESFTVALDRAFVFCIDDLPAPRITAARPTIPTFDRAKLPAIRGGWEVASQMAKEYSQSVNLFLADMLEAYFNNKIAERLKAEYPRDLRSKQVFAKWIGHELREVRMAIRHPSTGDACRLDALEAHKGDDGRFSLYNKSKKSRSHTTNQLHDLLPIAIRPDVV